MSADPPPPPPLTEIGNYTVILKIAEGGMGTVYKAQNKSSGQVVAIKVVSPAMARNATLLKRFEREFKATYELDHPNIVRGLEFCGYGPAPFLVMEYVEGESLGQKIEREGRMPEAEALRLIAQVCQGLHRAHKANLIHRDVKPDNILITPDGEAKLTDLGLVKEAGEDLNLTRTGRGLGTPHFMAPEQFRDAKNADKRCDIYSLGATLYMMVTGQMPFSGCSPLDCWMKKINNDLKPPQTVVPDLSDRVSLAIMRAMSGKPEQRPETCREFVEDLYGQSTRAGAPAATVAAPATDTDLWYLVYQDEEQQSHTVKGSTDGIARALKDGLLGDASNIVAARTKQGPFLPLRQFAEFRLLVVAPEPMPAAGRGGRAAGAASGKHANPSAPPAAAGVAPGTGTMTALSSRHVNPNAPPEPATPAQQSGRFDPSAYTRPSRAATYDGLSGGGGPLSGAGNPLSGGAGPLSGGSSGGLASPAAGYFNAGPASSSGHLPHLQFDEPPAGKRGVEWLVLILVAVVGAGLAFAAWRYLPLK